MGDGLSSFYGIQVIDLDRQERIMKVSFISKDHTVAGRKESSMSTVMEILANKGSQVHTIAEGATVLEAIRKMNEHRIGSLVAVREDGGISPDHSRR